jgi:2-keto-4-pentenoate hydratase/2-oxohepta-3-ene-1,7-dioic acid hydratase in catechol pathway
MKLVTYRELGEARVGVLDGERVVDLQRAAGGIGKPLPADMISFILLGDEGLDIAEAALKNGAGEVKGQVTLCAPITKEQMRKNVFCVGRNYKLHIEEGFRARNEPVVYPSHLELFSKPPTTVIGPTDDIQWDSRATQRLDYEVEFALVIGKAGVNISQDAAYDHIYGYTVGNDVSAREVQRNHGQWFKGKSMDTFCPLGPCIVPKRYYPNPQNVRLTTKVNGEIRQDSNTADMLYNIPRILEILSTAQTLEPGDVIITGTPSGVAMGWDPPRWLKDGDLVECEVEGIGVLKNRVRKIA